MNFAEFSALKTLLDSDINTLPVADVDVERLLVRRGCKIRSFNLDDDNSVQFLKGLNVLEFAEWYEAFTYVENDEIIVFYNSKIQAERRRFAFAHELAHIKLGHTAAHSVLGFHDDFSPDLTQEEEANAFALALLAPPCVLQRSNIVDIRRISHFTLLNNDQSCQVCHNLHNIKDLNEAENALCTQFSAFIRNNNRRRIKPVFLFNIFLLAAACIAGIICFNSLFSFVPKQSNQPVSNVTPQPVVTTSPAPAETSSKTVVITKSGARYHLPECGHIKNRTNTTELDVPTAVSMGYTPCKDCNP